MHSMPSRTISATSLAELGDGLGAHVHLSQVALDVGAVARVERLDGARHPLEAGAGEEEVLGVELADFFRRRVRAETPQQARRPLS